ncbi:MAG: glycerate kinase [Chitinophagaceae bacterium]|nr:glycerate kinase [Chitinophagaceae bacterium]
MRILIAPNTFKNSLPAAAAAEAIREGLEQSDLVCTTTLFPVGDGGDGTGALITHQCRGEIIVSPVRDPLGRSINAEFGLIDNGRTAVIEMAAASGLRLLKSDELDPMRASSYGTGLQIKQAIEKGAKKIILCVGGSATVDGGCGLLRALGFRFLDGKGNELESIAAIQNGLTSIDDSPAHRYRQLNLTVLCDVRNPLLGDNGAAAVFGPQKGASPQQLHLLEAGLRQLASIIQKQTGRAVGEIEHGGAAGGVAAGLHGIMGAALVNGIDHFMQLTDFDSALRTADLVITGEGSLDRQTLDGKAPYGVAMHSRQLQVPVIAMAGKIEAEDRSGLLQYFMELININEEDTGLAAALAATGPNLVRCSKDLGNRLAKKSRLPE